MKKQLCNFLSSFSKPSGWLQSVALLAVRLWIGKIFFMSGLTKTQSWDSTVALFADEYKLPLLPPEIAAYAGTTAELSLSILMFLGFLTPLAGIGLMIMTLVIELLVYPNTTEHYYWMLLLGIIITHGSGRFGVDHWLFKRKLFGN
jgi:putative oxidoreductase